MLEILANPKKHADIPEEGIAHIVHELMSPPVPSFLVESEMLRLSYAARSRYKHSALPPQIINVTEPIEHLRQQQSLAEILAGYGPDQLRQPDHFRHVLRQKWNGEVTEEELAGVLTMMAASENPSAWHSECLVQALEGEASLPPNFDWDAVIGNFDREDFQLNGQEGLFVIINAFRQTGPSSGCPIHQLWAGRWKHPRSQWSMLHAYLKADALDVTKESGLRKIFTSNDFANASSSLKVMVATFEADKLISVDAVDVLLYFALDEEMPLDVRNAATQELDRAAKFVPELVLCGALEAPQPWSVHMETVIDSLFDMFFEGHTSQQMVFWRLWQVDKHLVAQRFVDAYSRNPLSLTRILDIAQELRCLGDLLEIRNAMFILDVAALAARREHLNLDKWLNEMLGKFGGEFWGECYRFLRLKADAEYLASREGGKATMVNLRVGPVYSFLTALDNRYADFPSDLNNHANLASVHPPMGQELQEHVTQTQRICIQAYPRLINMGNGFDSLILSNNNESNSFSAAIDQDMQQNYRALYAQEREIRDLVNYMQKLKRSEIARDQDLFCCMIHGLFDEYDCYPKYPIHALATTSVLFGSIIRYGVIDGIPLRVALAMVYQAVRDHTASSSMYKFGLQALFQFQDRLREWKSYCTLLSQVSGLQGTDVWTVVQEVVAAGDSEKQIEAPVTTNGSVDRDDDTPELLNGNSLPPSPELKPAFRSLHAESPLRDDAAFEDPTEEVQDKVLFIVNNVSQSNLDSKLKELREWLEESHHQWFADYLVVKRAKMEPNYHGLYLDLLEKFGHKGLTTEVLRETYINVIKLLNAETTLSNSTERAHLKNLGSWLGGLTLAKDKPIKFKNISFKDLILEGWETDRLIVVLPFTCKVLEQVNKSTAFKPPNPWLMAILKLLKELYENVSLKLNLKFEIEVLCKNLGLDVKDLECGTDIAEVKERQAVKEVEEEEEAALIQLDNLSLQQHQQDYPPMSNQIPPSFSDNIAINSIIRDPTVKRIIIAAIERTAHEILGPVVERSVAIATIATSQLIQKDFATEPDENKMRTSAIGMAQRLAGHLALVTCKEPMRLSMVNNIRNGLLQSGFSESAVSEQAVTMIVNDNLEYVCRTVESAAEREAVPQIDDSLRPSYQIRKRHRDQRTGQPFIAPEVSRYALQLPDVFRLKPGGLTPQQLGVYDEFARASPVTTNEAPKGQTLDGYEYLPTNFQQGTPGIAETPIEHQRLVEPPPASPPPPAIDPATYQEKLVQAINEMRHIADTSAEEHLHDLQDGHMIFQYIENILQHIGMIPNNGNKVKENVCTAVASHLCNMVYAEEQGELEIESLVFLLRKLCEMSASTAKEVVMWLARDKEDGANERILNVKATVVLLRSQLLSVPHLDLTLSKLISAKKTIALQFLGRLLNETQFGDAPLLYRTDFAASFDAIGEWLKQDPSNTAAAALLNDLQDNEVEVEGRDIKDQMEYIFAEWVQLFQHNSTTDKSYSAFIIQLHQGKILADLESTLIFFRTCIEFCITEYENLTQSGSSLATNCYIPTDALAKMVMLLVKYQVDDADSNAQLDKAQYLESLLALVVVIFNHHSETRSENICQKVFFRLFSSLLFEFRTVENQLVEYRERFLEAFAECFLTMQPAFFPVFAFHWATLICHRYFMPKLLSTEKVRLSEIFGKAQSNCDQGQVAFTKLLSTFLNYLGVLLKENQPMQGVVKILHQGALRLLLVLHHDFPTYLSEYYFLIVDAIPTECTQLRNLVLSTLPPTLAEFPDPFGHGLDIKSLPGIKDSPTIRGDVAGALRKAEMKDFVDSIVKSEQEPTDEKIIAITERLETGPTSGFVNVDVSTINSLMLYVGLNAIETAKLEGAEIFQPDAVTTSLLTRIALDLKPYGMLSFISR